MNTGTKMLAAVAGLMLLGGSAFAGDCGSKDVAKGDCGAAASCDSKKVAQGGADDSAKGDCGAKAACDSAKVAQGGADDAAKGACASSCSADGKAVAQGGAEDAGKKGCGDGGKCEGKCSATAQGGAEDAGKAGNTGFELGKAIPSHELPNIVTGTNEALFDGKAKATVITFWNQNCPYVVEVDERFQAFAKEYSGKGVRVVAIDSNFNNSTEEIKEHASARPSFTLLRDADSMTALAFGAARTPEVFILDGSGVIQYHGAFDGGQKAPEKTFAKDAVNSILAGSTPEVTKTRAFGCTIKWAEAAKNAQKEKEATKTAAAN
ncbi:MAG: redoxin domain-containing protein [Candidatus Sumerlaeia bacterium]|nr:redoxin domain-containing protein [Candidatus Sumerlaeia bacterium]